MGDRKPNTLHIEVHTDGVPLGDVTWAVVQVMNKLNDGTMATAMVLESTSGDEIGMACMVYREPTSHGGQG